MNDTIITLDALGCQKSIAGQIIAGGGDYTFAVKDNHPTLAGMLEQAFLEAFDFERLPLSVTK